VYYIVDKFCDFETFAMINYGVCSNLKNLFILGLEFPELYTNLSWFNIYLKSKTVSFLDRIKNMYKDFVEKCEKRGEKCTVINAINLYGIYNYQQLAHPRLRGYFDLPYTVDLVNPLTDFTLDKLPKFAGEDDPRQQVKPHNFINPTIDISSAFEKKLGNPNEKVHRSYPTFKRKFNDGRKYKGGGIRLH
jgi:hypothetical protein